MLKTSLPLFLEIIFKPIFSSAIRNFKFNPVFPAFHRVSHNYNITICVIIRPAVPLISNFRRGSQISAQEVPISSARSRATDRNETKVHVLLSWHPLVCIGPRRSEYTVLPIENCCFHDDVNRYRRSIAKWKEPPSLSDHLGLTRTFHIHIL